MNQCVRNDRCCCPSSWRNFAWSFSHRFVSNFAILDLASAFCNDNTRTSVHIQAKSSMQKYLLSFSQCEQVKFISLSCDGEVSPSVRGHSPQFCLRLRGGKRNLSMFPPVGRLPWIRTDHMKCGAASNELIIFCFRYTREVTKSNLLLSMSIVSRRFFFFATSGF